MNVNFLAFEFSPVAEEIWKIKQSSAQGFHFWDTDGGVVSFFDVANHDAKIRPEVLSIYAAGKATNVIRVLAGLCRHFQISPFPSIALHTFLADPKRHADSATNATSAFIRSLQQGALAKIHLSYSEVAFANPEGKARRAIHVIEQQTQRDLLNFTPRLQWSTSDTEKIVTHLSSLTTAPWVVLAGTPPIGAELLYLQAINKLRTATISQKISLDASGSALQACLDNTDAHPNIICINSNEYYGIDRASWQKYRHPVFVHNQHGCWIISGNGGRLYEHWESVPFIDISMLQKHMDKKIGPTLGAGDAFHAGVIFAVDILKLSEINAAKFALAVASFAVRSGVGVSEINYRKIEEMWPVFFDIPETQRNPRT